MPTANSFDPKLLLGALEAARRAMQRLDAKEIPQKIRAVAKQSGKLAPPLALSLLNELDRNEWLREKAADELSGESRASWLFLHRETGWLEELTEIGAERSQQDQRAAQQKAETELKAARAQIEKLRRDLASLKAQPKAVPVSPAPRRPDPVGPELNVLRRLEADLRRQITELTSTNQELSERVEGLLRRQTKGSRQARQPGSTRSASGLRRQALALARDLDTRFLAAAINPQLTPESADPSLDQLPALKIPRGVRPDLPEAIDWLMSEPGPVTVAVDGWNLAFQLKTPPGKRERKQVEAAVGRLSIKAAGPRKLLVYFDSRHDLAESAEGLHRAVEVEFPASADEALIELATRVERLVVISSDRRVREESARNGAVALWGAGADRMAPLTG